MVDATSAAQRRSTRERKETLKVASNADSDGSASETPSESEDETFRVSAKRSRAKGPAKRSVKRAKRSNKTFTTVDTDEEVEEDADRVENFLYEAIMDGEASIDTLVADYLDSYAENTTESLKDLINSVLRASGTKQEITSFDVEDTDTIPETLTQLQDHLTGKDHDVIKTTTDTYPWISKHKSYKVFRKQLPDFWRILVTRSFDKGYLLDDESGSLWSTIESWLVSMSSSTLRSFRHTSTVICLVVMSALIGLLSKSFHDVEVANRQWDAEDKKSKKSSARMKTIEKTITQKNAERERLSEMVSNYFDSVFVHRYRDIDARIRSDNIKELGSWMMKLPSVFFEGNYLRYLGWVLSDTSGTTRLEVIRALTPLYGLVQYAENLRHFTSRFKNRIIEIAVEDAETNIRCAALGLLDKIRDRGYLEDDDIAAILGCIYDREPRVRVAARETFQSVLSERENDIIDEQLGGDVEDHGELKSGWTNLKALVATLNTLSKELDSAEAADKGRLDIGREQDVFSPGRTRIAAESFLVGLHNVEFDHVVKYLLFDNDATIEPASTKAKDVLKSVLALSAREESMLLEILVATSEIARASEEARRSKKDDEDLTISISIMNNLPLLIARFKDSVRLSIVLQLVSICDLSVYSKMRQTARLEEFLDMLISLFFGYSEESILRSIGSCMLLLSQESTLQTLVKDKFLDLQDSVRNAILDDTEAQSLETSLQRLIIVSSVDDCVLSFEDERADGTSIYSKLKDHLQSSHDIVASNARLCLRNYFMWKLKQLLDTRFSATLKDIQTLLEKRDDILFILDAQVEEGNHGAALIAAELEAISTSLYEIENFDGLAVRRPLDVNLQTLIVSALQKEMKRFARISHKAIHHDEEIVSDEESDEEAESGGVRLLDSERKVCTVAGEMVAAMAAGKMDVKYIPLLLSNKGRLGASYDAILREIPENLLSATKKVAPRTKAAQSAPVRASSEDVLLDDDIET